VTLGAENVADVPIVGRGGSSECTGNTIDATLPPERAHGGNGNIGNSTNSSRSIPRFGVAKAKTT
jgi:hypothetical protein